MNYNKNHSLQLKLIKLGIADQNSASKILSGDSKEMLKALQKIFVSDNPDFYLTQIQCGKVLVSMNDLDFIKTCIQILVC